MTIKVDKKKCIGCGACVAICPQIFELDKNGKAQVKVQKKLPCVKDAIDGCPVEAISQ